MPTESFSAVIHRENSKVGIAGLPNTFRFWDSFVMAGLGDLGTRRQGETAVRFINFVLSPCPPSRPAPQVLTSRVNLLSEQYCFKYSRAGVVLPCHNCENRNFKYLIFSILLIAIIDISSRSFLPK